jgi:hypothetical protein
MVEHSTPDELDPINASFEDHIFVLSSFKGAVPTSQEYRDRLSDGSRHPETQARRGEEFVYIKRMPNALVNPDAHAYLLDRSKGRFVTYDYSPNAIFPSVECIRDDRGWWVAPQVWPTK